MFYRHPAWGVILQPRTLASGAAYTGPGDIVSGAAGWWGLRAYNAAQAAAGVAAVQLTDSTGSNNADIHLLSNGQLNTSDPFFSSFSAPYTIGTLYDQSGNGKHIIRISRRPHLIRLVTV